MSEIEKKVPEETKEELKDEKLDEVAGGTNTFFLNQQLQKIKQTH